MDRQTEQMRYLNITGYIENYAKNTFYCLLSAILLLIVFVFSSQLSDF
jgi:hypothetical protein